MKELLAITHIKDDICEIKCKIDDIEEAEILTSALFGLMCHDERIAKAVSIACEVYKENPQESQDVASKATIDVPFSHVAS